MKKLLTLAHSNGLGSRDQLGAAWVASFLGVVLVIGVAIWAAMSLA
jgi:hypothetical protein